MARQYTFRHANLHLMTKKGVRTLPKMCFCRLNQIEQLPSAISSRFLPYPGFMTTRSHCCSLLVHQAHSLWPQRRRFSSVPHHARDWCPCSVLHLRSMLTIELIRPEAESTPIRLCSPKIVASAVTEFISRSPSLFLLSVKLGTLMIVNFNILSSLCFTFFRSDLGRYPSRSDPRSGALPVSVWSPGSFYHQGSPR